jgi:hypothetical protein
MWHSFLALPLVVRIIAWTGGAAIALYTAIKSKAIHAAMKKAREAVAARFWRWVHTKAALGRPQDSNERTYKGIFQDYWYSSTPRAMNFFRVTQDGVATTVQVLDTNLLAGLKSGTFVEIDTEARASFEYEIVRRVRVHDA